MPPQIIPLESPLKGVALWRVELDSIDLAEARSALSPDEWQRTLRFAFDIHRNRFAAARFALRRVIGESLGCAPDALRISVGPHGKPYLPAATHCHFNVSHSDGVGLIALSRSGPVGVDIEIVNEVRDLSTVSPGFMSPSELALWKSLCATDREQAFYLCWTRKEAVLKASGLGLHHDPCTVHVGLADSDVSTTIECEGTSATFRVRTLEAGRARYVAVASQALET
ncbi:MAG: 4'-phosphopantetheinyl transferase superfamily protein [Betaproteobacteria bacterium]|nr:4'-phosphopantetheinyl transferase superfamily protein [Betaproteobacteria bacterium]